MPDPGFREVTKKPRAMVCHEQSKGGQTNRLYRIFHYENDIKSTDQSIPFALCQCARIAWHQAFVSLDYTYFVYCEINGKLGQTR